MAGLLYLVATPIGNLEDITYRAVRVLREADLIACEDTRQTRKLLDHYDIHKPTISYHEHNEMERTEELVAQPACRSRDRAGFRRRHAAGVRPGIPAGARGHRCGIPVQAVPGPSASLTALAASGLPTDSFHFGGFLPVKPGQRAKALEALAEEHATLIFYEAPHRILEALEAIETALGPRPVVVARELTKIHEEYLRGTAAEVRAQLAARDSVKGEITLLIGKATEPPPDDTPVEEAVETLIGGHAAHGRHQTGGAPARPVETGSV